VLEAADLNQGLACGREAGVACRVPVEMRPFGWRRTRGKGVGPALLFLCDVGMKKAVDPCEKETA
jgi:hypothetical protein